MAFLSEENQREIKTIFEQLDHDVHLEFFTERESPIIIPGGNCPTCKDTRLLLQEVVALSDKLHLDVHEVTTTGEAARQQGIDRIPALIMSAEGVQGKINPLFWFAVRLRISRPYRQLGGRIEGGRRSRRRNE